MILVCIYCEEQKPEEAFCVDRRRKTGRRIICRECSRATCRKYQKRNKAKIAKRKAQQRRTAESKEAERKYAQKYHEQKRELRNSRSRTWHARNRKRVAKRRALWMKLNSHRCAAATRRRDAKKRHAMPAWADKQAILAFYAEAASLSRETGIPHEVDHIYPLQSPIMCGLHVETNLQILTKAENAAKYNRVAATLQNNS